MMDMKENIDICLDWINLQRDEALERQKASTNNPARYVSDQWKDGYPYGESYSIQYLFKDGKFSTHASYEARGYETKRFML